jgi:hypothetical protein
MGMPDGDLFDGALLACYINQNSIVKCENLEQMGKTGHCHNPKQLERIFCLGGISIGRKAHRG